MKISTMMDAHSCGEDRPYTGKINNLYGILAGGECKGELKVEKRVVVSFRVSRF